MMSPSGALLLDKSSGWTSHDVVAKLRTLLKVRRIGHAGTLDPMATGLLVVAVGPATRLLRFCDTSLKHYRATVRLGVATDSLDADGVETAQSAVPSLSPSDVERAARALTGPIQQIPPMVSARHHEGRRLHEIARAGETVERAAREVVVHHLEATLIDASTLELDVICSTGTYVRVLAADLAESLGTLGHLTALRRTQIGDFSVNDAVTIEQAEGLSQEGALMPRPAATLVAHLDQVTLSDDQVLDVRHGRALNLDVAPGPIAALDTSGELVAVLRHVEGITFRGDVVLATN